MDKLHSDCRDFGASVATPTEISSVTRFEGHAFGVESVTLERDGKRFVRDIVRHAPCVNIFAYDTETESVLLEREFRIGCGRVTTGLPAGYIDPDEIGRGGDFEKTAAERVAGGDWIRPRFRRVRRDGSDIYERGMLRRGDDTSHHVRSVPSGRYRFR